MRLFFASSMILGVVLLAPLCSPAQDIHLHLPKKSKSTPVQNYNREGVSALESHDYQKAKKLFYKAYLLDPNDPFTLNNLGYVAELDGQVDRARRFYGLSEAMHSEAAVDKSTSKDAEGKPVAEVAGHFEQGRLQVNQLNLEAISFLLKGRPYEAEKILKTALEADPKSAFTLNNLGYDMEMQGETEKAVGYYDQAANLRSDQKVIVAVNKNWRGKPISEIAAGNSQRLQQALNSNNTPEAQVALLNLRGVSALNRNDRKAARGYFEEAYKEDPENAFALNNMGYLSELDGDRETAQLYYEKATQANRAKEKVTVASDPHVEGKRLEAVASASDQVVDARMQADLEARRRSYAGSGSVTLGNRGYSRTPPPQEEVAPAATQPPEGPVETNPNPAQPGQTAPPSPEQSPQPKPPAVARPDERDPVSAPK